MKRVQQLDHVNGVTRHGPKIDLNEFPNPPVGEDVDDRIEATSTMCIRSLRDHLDRSSQD